MFVVWSVPKNVPRSVHTTKHCVDGPRRRFTALFIHFLDVVFGSNEYFSGSRERLSECWLWVFFIVVVLIFGCSLPVIIDKIIIETTNDYFSD